ncbi:MAG: M23 family metallopeptidase [Candidatus Riflebacteria bacterium]|nr:M23 family metallopeptidase [Candidatus Riflebacteria bacterium]
MLHHKKNLPFIARLTLFAAAWAGVQLFTPSPEIAAFQIQSDLSVAKRILVAKGEASIVPQVSAADRRPGQNLHCEATHVFSCSGISPASSTSWQKCSAGPVVLAAQQYDEFIRSYARVSDWLVYRLARTLAAPTPESALSRRFRVVSIQSVKSVEGLLWPVQGSISSGFGLRLHPITHRRSFHGAIDIRSNPGTPVAAPSDGVVIEAARDGAIGRVVRIRTSNQTILSFGHLAGYRCVCGQYVRRGQIIGLVGSSGRATGPHLHFAVQVHGRYLNPLIFLSRR